MAKPKPTSPEPAEVLERWVLCPGVGRAVSDPHFLRLYPCKTGLMTRPCNLCDTKHMFFGDAWRACPPAVATAELERMAKGSGLKLLISSTIAFLRKE